MKLKTVKEVSKLAGVSIRTLHYYDEIGLLNPTETTQAGYRLYDSAALEKLQQILFFRELDMPLEQIKVILEDAGLAKNLLLRTQKKLLQAKKDRLEKIIASIDDILKGENKMNFEIFSKADIEQLYEAMQENMTDGQKEIFIRQYGSLEQFKQRFLENASSDSAQKNYAKVVKWYGNKESALNAAANPDNSKIMEAYSKRLDSVLSQLAEKVGTDVCTFEVKMLVGELDFATKQLYQMKDVSAFLLDMAEQYQTDPQMQERLDAVYGAGSTAYIGKALKAFYQP